jgi:hypothetical protein
VLSASDNTKPAYCRKSTTRGTPILESARMYLVQILLPVYDNDGRPFPASSYADVRRELTERFGGLTASYWCART